MPKQLMPFLSARSLLQETILRLNGGDRLARPIIISNADHRFIIAAQLQELGIEPLVHVLEPVGRNTAAAAAVAAEVVASVEKDGILLLLPADHHITDIEGFRDAVAVGAAQAAAGNIVTFGIVPQSPEVGYGYIERGERLDDGATFLVAQFWEKPNLEKATGFLAAGGYYWNCLLYTSPSPRDRTRSRMPSSA